jgi:hypothetical protein
LVKPPYRSRQAIAQSTLSHLDLTPVFAGFGRRSCGQAVLTRVFGKQCGGVCCHDRKTRQSRTQGCASPDWESLYPPVALAMRLISSAQISCMPSCGQWIPPGGRCHFHRRLRLVLVSSTHLSSSLIYFHTRVPSTPI